MSDDRQVFTVISNEGGLVLAGELDAATVPDLDEALLSRNGERDVTMDVSELTFIDSSGIHAIAAFVESREPEGTVTLRGASPHVRRVFEITCLTELPKLRLDG